MRAVIPKWKREVTGLEREFEKAVDPKEAIRARISHEMGRLPMDALLPFKEFFYNNGSSS